MTKGSNSGEGLPLVAAGRTRDTRSKEEEKQNRESKAAAKACLLFVGSLYGSLDLGMKILLMAEHGPSPASACVVKTAIGMIAFAVTVALSSSDKTKERKGLLWPALSLAFWIIVSGAFMYEGIKRTTVSRASILLQLSVVATPVLERVGLGRSQPAVVWVGAAVAFFGVSLLSYSPGASGSGTSALGHNEGSSSVTQESPPAQTTFVGDFLVTAGAVLWGWYLVLTAALPPSLDATALQGVKYAFALIMYTVWAYIQHVFLGAPAVLQGWHSISAWIWIFYIALVPGALSDVLQQRAQVLVRASEAGILLASEPVWATLLAIPILGERLTSFEIVGGLLILVAAGLVSWAQDEISPISERTTTSVADNTAPSLTNTAELVGLTRTTPQFSSNTSATTR